MPSAVDDLGDDAGGIVLHQLRVAAGSGLDLELLAQAAGVGHQFHAYEAYILPTATGGGCGGGNAPKY